MAGWQRLRRSPVGLVPINGQPMTIRRDRLAQAIDDAEATPLAIDWIGPAEIKVEYRKLDPAEVRAREADKVAQVAYEAATSDDHTDLARRPRLSEAEAKRAIYWIELAMKRQLPSIAEEYRIEIDKKQQGLTPLQFISGVTSIEPVGKIEDGVCRFQVVGRTIEGPATTLIEATLSAHPTVVVPRRSLPRGHLIQANDLELMAIPEEELDSGYVLDPQELVGLEVRGVVRSKHPIIRGDVGSPILIHRGDLIELRVIGGGITVSTNAKAIGDGAVSDLIEIETLQPRKRLIARVAEPGVAEIVTRAPKVKR